MSSLLLSLPEELQGSCARMLEPPSAGRFAEASKACAQLVRAQLIVAKAVHDAARAQQLAQAPRPRRIVFTANRGCGGRHVSRGGFSGKKWGVVVVMTDS